MYDARDFNAMYKQEEFAHFGVKGMKWHKHLKAKFEDAVGITARRNFQNANSDYNRANDAYINAQNRASSAAMSGNSFRQGESRTVNGQTYTAGRNANYRDLQSTTNAYNSALQEEANRRRATRDNAARSTEFLRNQYNSTILGRAENLVNKAKNSISNISASAKGKAREFILKFSTTSKFKNLFHSVEERDRAEGFINDFLDTHVW